MFAKTRSAAGRFLARYQARESGRILGNSGWLAAERALSFVLALLVHVLLARHLGVEQFGLLSYAISFVGLFGAFTYLGFSGIVTRDLVARPDERDELLGTTFAMKLAGAAVAIAIIVPLAQWLSPDPRVRILIHILAIGLVFDGFRVINFWYESRLEARYSVIATGAGALTSSGLKLALIAAAAPLVWFAVATAAQGLVTAVAIVVLYQKQGHALKTWRVRASRARSLSAQSWPLLISSVAGVIYLKIDQVMLGYMAGAEAVGVYSVAARLSEVWYFLPAILATSLLPAIVKSRTLPEGHYRARMQRIYDAMFLAGLAVAVPISLLAAWVVRLLYGAEFTGAGAILAIHIWACPAMFMGAALSKWLIAEGFLTFSITRHLIGAAANVVLNLILIPPFGGVGAAVATVVSYTCASYLACFIDPRTREAGRMMTKALLSPVRKAAALR